MTTKRDKNNKDLSPEKIQALKDAYRKEADTYKQRVKPLVSFLRKNKLRFSHAHVGNERIEYFRIDDFEKLLEENNEQIQKDEVLSALAKNALAEFVFFKRPEGIKIKYPKNLQPVPPTNLDKKYASFRFDTTESKRGMTILVIILVLSVVLFPIWPFSVKYALWLVSLVLLVVLVGIIVVRMLLYLVCVIFNYHIWIFPNLFFSSGFFDSFIPVIEISKGDRSWFNIFIRIFGISAFMLLALHVYMNPTFLDETFKQTKVTISDVHDWGVAKIKNQGNFSQRALTNLNTILNETEIDHNQSETGETNKTESIYVTEQDKGEPEQNEVEPEPEENPQTDL